jgi:hypothetical protein
MGLRQPSAFLYLGGSTRTFASFPDPILDRFFMPNESEDIYLFTHELEEESFAPASRVTMIVLGIWATAMIASAVEVLRAFS